LAPPKIAHTTVRNHNDCPRRAQGARVVVYRLVVPSFSVEIVLKMSEDEKVRVELRKRSSNVEKRRQRDRLWWRVAISTRARCCRIALWLHVTLKTRRTSIASLFTVHVSLSRFPFSSLPHRLSTYLQTVNCDWRSYLTQNVVRLANHVSRPCRSSTMRGREEQKRGGE